MTPKRPEFQLILVVTEGTATEREYIERLGQYLRSETSTVRVKTVGVGKDPLSVVRKAVELRDGNAQPRLRGRKVAAKGSKRAKYDAVFCLVDVDDHASLPQAITLARQENIGILVSNLKFETWLLWHVEDRRAELNSRELDAMMAKHNLLTHKHLPTRFPFEGVQQAMRIADLADPNLDTCRQGPNPSSAMPVLVRRMMPPG